ncbi:DUF4376 domain-containing protein [Laribacter hongkongensis]|uniref:DUF4376 domain containing protein n=1 Tax=Laribacter hongkongensis TaxID=168471 RepID=A0A248LKK6_9NEIS|nr:DUF4376 domain containing protein [Laribacter hongkongensis]
MPYPEHRTGIKLLRPQPGNLGCKLCGVYGAWICHGPEQPADPHSSNVERAVFGGSRDYAGSIETRIARAGADRVWGCRYHYYKDQSGRVYFLESADYASLLPAGCIPITDAEASELLAPDPEPLDTLRDRAPLLLPAWEKSERAAGIEHAGHLWLITPLALQDIRDVLLAGAVPGEQWVAADRQIVPMTLPELQSLWQAITARGAQIYQRRLEMEQQIADMSREQLEAFVPGWPEPVQA